MSAPNRRQTDTQKTPCGCCGCMECPVVYSRNYMPALYGSCALDRLTAEGVKRVRLNLRMCLNCGFAWNDDFRIEDTKHDANYRFDLSYSTVCSSNFDNLVVWIGSHGLLNSKIVEIGCGSGFLLDKLRNAGADAIGFEPTYSGSKPYIISDYFSEKYDNINAELVIMRHVLEHIPDFRKLLELFRDVFGEKCMLYLDVPAFEWSFQHKAFWNIYHGHCSYFTRESLLALYPKAIHQYTSQNTNQFVLAKAGDLTAPGNTSFSNGGFSVMGISPNFGHFDVRIDSERWFVENHPGLICWGGVGGGPCYANTIDPARKYIRYLIDINPNLKNKYIFGSGHEIESPSALKMISGGDILIMNTNYKDEIAQIAPADFTLHTLW